MKTCTFFNLEEAEWRPFGGSTKGVLVKDISTKAYAEEFNLSLFKVETSGEFPRHKHSHAHVLYFLSGKGECWIGKKQYKTKPGDVALIQANEEHGYKNTGGTDMLLIVLNKSATR